MKIKNKKPWRDEKGNLLSDEQLETLSKGWSEETWDDYLKDTVDVKQKELTLGDPQTAENIPLQKSKIFDQLPRINLRRNPELKKTMRAIVDDLPKKEREVTKMLYWHELSESEVARRMNCNKSSIQRLHKSILKHLGDEIVRIINLGNARIR